jgi:hypothetical protein
VLLRGASKSKEVVAGVGFIANPKSNALSERLRLSTAAYLSEDRSILRKLKMHRAFC